jgi:multidrug efflux pump subunit AcrB
VTRRIARYRDSRHSGRDPLDYGVTAGALIIMTLVNLAVFIPVLTTVGPLHYEGLVITAVLIITASNLVIMRGVSVLGQHMVRRWVFDREQRRHEIVPLTKRSRTSA